jgi:serine/threonine protein kinase
MLHNSKHSLTWCSIDKQKPDNIGFDSCNVLKLFDFGLAKELLDKDRTTDGLYINLTGMTGAIRYNMAPEVGLGKPYNLTADVYSWSMLMWFILALEPPFGFYSEHMIIDRVFRRGSRPAIFKAWNEIIGDLMRCAWDVDVANRPSFLEISLCLKQELIDSDGGTVAASSTASVTDSGDERHNSLSATSISVSKI